VRQLCAAARIAWLGMFEAARVLVALLSRSRASRQSPADVGNGRRSPVGRDQAESCPGVIRVRLRQSSRICTVWR